MKKIIPIIILVLALCQAGALSVWADDTDIYGVTTISMEPNVLIIFDNSGSMNTEDVPGEQYNPALTYAGSKTKNAVYRYSSGSYSLFTGDVNNITCPSIKNALLTKGYAVTGTGGIDNINTTTFACGSKSRTLRLGNWINYDATGAGDNRSRLEVAKEAIANLIETTDNVRFGLMNFHYNDTDSSTPPYLYKNGGKIVKAMGTSKTDLTTAVTNMTTEMYTPLAETLAEAGLYFAGKASWYNSGVTYTSPIQERCQKNYIIFMTDGDPTNDNNGLLTTGTYINGNKIADYDGDGSSGKLDDVSKYLYDNDLRSDMGIPGESFERQNVITYTIGFKSDQPLLQATATNGGGKYYTTNSASGLSAAFEEIMSSIADVNAVFVSPVVPVSRMNRTYAGNSLYVGFFKPDNSGRWLGNIKKYGLDSDGVIIDKFGVTATLSDGSIKNNATSYWSISPDGPNVLMGGAGGVVSEQTSRNLYTHMGTAAALTDSTNAFSKTNAAITAAVLDVDAANRDGVIDDIHGVDKAWVMGDILHSQPAVVHYDTNGDGTLDDAFIFSGSNDGMMHCIKDSTGEEQWGFIPPDQLPRLQLLSDAATTHDYFVDGSSVVYQPDGGQKTLFFGERRGGVNYYVLNVTTPAAPSFLYTIGPGILGGGAAQLGQSWCAPPIAEIKTATGSDMVFLMGGGYDTNQDKPTLAAPTIYPAASDSQGRAVFSVKIADGTVSSLNMNGANYPAMNHSIVDLAGFDTDGDGFVNRVYAGDLGGQMFAFEDDEGDGVWSGRKLFSASADGVQRKCFYATDAVAETYGEMIFFGTGDREHPNSTDVVNRIYAIKNEWTSPAPATLTESDLLDVTDDLIQMGTEAEKEAARDGLENSKGWYFRLENLGEQITSSVTVYAGVAYFTTYTPEAGAVVVDPCEAASGRGQARLYAVDYLTGSSVYDFNPETGSDGGLGKKDRSEIIGTSMPSAPVIAILPGLAVLFVGVEGGVAQQNPNPVTELNLFYWRQITN